MEYWVSINTKGAGTPIVGDGVEARHVSKLKLAATELVNRATGVLLCVHDF